jgi:hypothetical protein
MFKSVTVLANLADAETIELACSTGRPRLVLRGGRDSDVVATAGISLSTLRGEPATPIVVAPTPINLPPVEITPTTKPTEATAHREVPTRTVKVIRAGQESTVTMTVSDPSLGDTYTDTKDQNKDPFDR